MEGWEDWQKVYQFGTIVIVPPDEVCEIVDAQRQRIDPVSQSYCGTHITVTQPFIRSLNAAEWGQLNERVKTFESFEIRYGPLKTFLPYPCIYYQIDPSERILEMRGALHRTGFFNLSLSHTHDFIPHMTITEGLSGPSVDEVLFEKLSEESCPGSFRCTELAFIVPDEAFSFQIVYRLRFKP